MTPFSKLSTTPTEAARATRTQISNRVTNLKENLHIIMNLRILVILAVSAAVAALDDDDPRRNTIKSRLDYDDVDYYSCAGKPDGHYNHPHDCTRFIHCHNHRAADKCCPDCNTPTQCHGHPYLVWNQEKDYCDYHSNVPSGTCSTGTTAAPVTMTLPPVTTEAPPVTTEAPPVTTEAPPVTTAAPPVTTTDAPDNPPSCSSITVGDSCDPDCHQVNCCINKVAYYYRCQAQVPANPFNPVTGAWVQETCASGYLVDPTKPLAEGYELGGQCTAWDDLDSTTADNWMNDAECGLERDLCTYGQDSEDNCSKNYWFQQNLQSAREDKQCEGANDIWNPATENCGPCSDVAACTCGEPV